MVAPCGFSRWWSLFLAEGRRLRCWRPDPSTALWPAVAAVASLWRGEYLRWLEADLKAARDAGKKWIIAGGHRPLVSWLWYVVMIKVEFGGHYKLLLVIAMAVKSVSSFKKLQDQDFECPGPIFWFRFVNCALDRNSFTWKTDPTETSVRHSGMIELLELLGGEAVMKRYMKSNIVQDVQVQCRWRFQYISMLSTDWSSKSCIAEPHSLLQTSPDVVFISGSTRLTSTLLAMLTGTFLSVALDFVEMAAIQHSSAAICSQNVYSMINDH